MSKTDSGPLKVADLVELFGVDPQEAADWFHIRKAKGQKDLTQTAWRRHCREAEAAGITPAQAVTFCAENEAWGFYAAHYQRVKNPALPRPQFGRPDPSVPVTVESREHCRTVQALKADEATWTPEARAKAEEARKRAMERLGRGRAH